MARTSKRDLDQMARHLASMTGLPVRVSWAYGQPRLESEDGAHEISPRLPSGQLMDWMRAFVTGFGECENKYLRRRMGLNPAPRPRRTRRRAGLIRDVRFFREHGGGVVGEATRGALGLARAEREAERRGWLVEWEWDDDADWSWLDQPGLEREKARDHEVYVATLKDRQGRALASLGGIFDPDDKYRRVVEAELAYEALARG